ncbi:MAG TPA: hypothetical protein VE133_11125 [Candidatus Sulfotelmatobacter sp.]|nr:hypothetical protein [Candidatus Sulfotelmatobacter sp.]
MTDHEKDKQLDDLLDSMLSSYSAIEPRPGLEARVLAGLRDEESRKAQRPWNFRWVWAASAVAAVIVILALWVGRHHPAAPPTNTIVREKQPAQPQQVHPQVRRSLPVMAGDAAQQRPQKQVPAGMRNVSLALNRRPPVFPTPAPLSEQEQLLLRYFAHTPKEELIAQSHPDEPPAIGEDESGLAVPDLVLVQQKSSNTQ